MSADSESFERPVLGRSTIASYRTSSTFVAMYHETMERLGADEDFFSSRHFQFMRERMRDRLQLFTCVIGNEPVAAALFFVTHGIVQYHLGGEQPGPIRSRLGPMKLLIDAARSWGTATGQKVLHLGGGT